MTRDALPVREEEAVTAAEPSRDATVHGVLLAAGMSSRYGDCNKLLEPLNGEPIVRHAARSLVESNVDAVTVVVGYESEGVKEALTDLDVDFWENDEYAAGQSTSVRAGVRAAAKGGADAALVALGDMPRVSPDSIDLLVAAYKRELGDVIAAAHTGRRGNPVLFDARFFEALTDLKGDTGGRELLRDAEEAVAIETSDPGVRRDVDRPEDRIDLE